MHVMVIYEYAIGEFVFVAPVVSEAVVDLPHRLIVREDIIDCVVEGKVQRRIQVVRIISDVCRIAAKYFANSEGVGRRIEVAPKPFWHMLNRIDAQAIYAGLRSQP